MSVITSNSSIYPPIVENVLPAQSLSQTEIKIPFQLSPFNTPDDLYKRSDKIGVMVWIRLLKKKTGLETDYDRKFWVNVDPTDSTFKDENTNFSTLTLSVENGVYSFPIGLTAQSSGTTLDLSAYIDCIFSIQLRVISKEYQQLDQNKEQWMSEWSKQCLFKIIPEVSLKISSFSDNNPSQFTYKSQTQHLSGKIQFLDREKNPIESTEQLKNYSFTLLRKIPGSSTEILLEEYKSNDIINNQINYIIKTHFGFLSTYKIKISIETINGYKEEYYYDNLKFSDYNPYMPLAVNTSEVTLDKENNNIEVVFNFNEFPPMNTKMAIRRREGNSDMWEDIGIYENEDKQLKIKDYLIEDGKTYTYCVEFCYDNRRGSIDENGYSEKIVAAFEDMSLIGKEQEVFHIKYNPNISNFQIRVADFVTETFGKYPFVRRNGNMRYKTFPIGGTIYIDDNITLTQSINTVMNTSDIQQNTSVLSVKEKEFISQKKFRDQIMDFLYDGEIKLFKSPTEGNMLVRLTDISFSPRQELGRMIYDFAATATEIDDYSLDNCKKYGIISKKEEIK